MFGSVLFRRLFFSLLTIFLLFFSIHLYLVLSSLEAHVRRTETERIRLTFDRFYHQVRAEYHDLRSNITAQPFPPVDSAAETGSGPGEDALLPGPYADPFRFAVPESTRVPEHEMVRTVGSLLDSLPAALRERFFIFDTGMNLIYPPASEAHARIFAAPDAAEGAAGELPLAAALMTAARQSDPVYRYNWNRPEDPDRFTYPHKAWVHYFAPLDWYMVLAVDAADIPSGTAYPSLGISFLLFAAALLLAALAIHHFVRPVNHLSGMAAEFIQRGDVSENRYLVDKGELGVIGAAFYRMINRIDEAGRQLKRSHEEKRRMFRLREKAREKAYELSRSFDNLRLETEALEAEKRSLHQSEERYRAMLENIEEYFYEVDLLGNLIFFNDALYKMLGYPKDELVGKNYREFMDEETAEKAKDAFKKAFENGQTVREVEWRLVNKDGESFYVELSASVIRDTAGEIIGFRGIARDISDLIYMIYHDSLTGLYNRKAFFERLRDTLAYARRDRTEKNIFYLDLDKFKQVNDIYGHDVGDGVLQEVADRLRTTLRETDHICRLGGDEFTVILNNVQHACPAEAAQRTIEALSRPYEIKEHIIDFITPSIGISTYPKDAEEIEALIKCADVAMYEAKKERGRYVFFDESFLADRDGNAADTDTAGQPEEA